MSAFRLKAEMTLQIDVCLSFELMETVPSIESTFTARIIPIVPSQVGIDLTVHINPLYTLGYITTKGALDAYFLLAIMHGFHNRSKLES